MIRKFKRKPKKLKTDPARKGPIPCALPELTPAGEQFSSSSHEKEVQLHLAAGHRHPNSPLRNKMLRLFRAHNSPRDSLGSDKGQLDLQVNQLQEELLTLRARNKQLRDSERIQEQLERSLTEMILENDQLRKHTGESPPSLLFKTIEQIRLQILDLVPPKRVIY